MVILMFSCYLPRYLQRAIQIKQIFNKIGNVSKNYCPSIVSLKMDRIEKILMADNDIERKIMALRCEVNDVEAKRLDNFLIERLERENRELEEEIDKYRNELVQLEKLNGRGQICSHSHVRETCAVQATETLPPPESSPASKETVLTTSKKEEKKESKKSDKSQAKKSDKGESKSQASDDLPIDIGRLDMKVGKIVEIEKHPDAESLYVEKVDIGKTEPITVVSGLVKHMSKSDLEGSLVVILCNLKPAKMRGVLSEGMVMCASVPDGPVEVLRPPHDSCPGETITCQGYNRNPDTIMNPKKKIFETVAPDLKTDDEMIATYKGTRWSVGEKGFVKAQTLKAANIK